MCNHIPHDNFNCSEWHIPHAKVFLLSHQKGETQERLCVDCVQRNRIFLSCEKAHRDTVICRGLSIMLKLYDSLKLTQLSMEQNLK